MNIPVLSSVSSYTSTLVKTARSKACFQAHFLTETIHNSDPVCAPKLSDYMMGRLLFLKLAGITDKSGDQMASAVGPLTSPIWSSWIRRQPSIYAPEPKDDGGGRGATLSCDSLVPSGSHPLFLFPSGLILPRGSGQQPPLRRYLVLLTT